MITKLEIENFYSFRDREVLDLCIRDSVPDDPQRFIEAYPGSGTRLPKVVAVYGANASGKSNLLRALIFLQQLVASSFQWPPSSRINITPFQVERGWNGETHLALSGGGKLVENEPYCEYRYEVAIQHSRSGAESIISELLTFSPRGRHQRILERVGLTLKPGPASGLRLSDIPKYSLRPNASMISTLAQFGYPLAVTIRDRLQKVLTNLKFARDIPDELELNPVAMQGIYAQNKDLLGRLGRAISKADLGVTGVEITVGPTGPIALFRHQGLSIPMNLINESAGTRKFFAIYPLLDLVLTNGGLAIIDELDTEIHPLLLPEIVGWFHDPHRNPHNAGLIFSCHDASLLHFLVKEEVFFTEKDGTGHTHLYGAQDIKGVRRDENLYKKYIGGVYGAVPHIG